MNKWLVATIVLLLMFASMIFGFILGAPNTEDLNAEVYVTGYNTAVRELAFIQLNETVIFLPLNETVEKVDLNSICGWEDGN